MLKEIQSSERAAVWHVFFGNIYHGLCVDTLVHWCGDREGISR